MNRVRCSELPSPRVPLSHRRAPIARRSWRHGQGPGQQCCGEGRNRCGCGRAASTAAARQRVCGKIGNPPLGIANAVWSAPRVAGGSLGEAATCVASPRQEGIRTKPLRFLDSESRKQERAGRRRRIGDNFRRQWAPVRTRPSCRFMIRSIQRAQLGNQAPTKRPILVLTRRRRTR